MSDARSQTADRKRSGVLLARVVLLAAFVLAGCTGQAQGAPPPAFDTGVDPDAWAQVPAGEFLCGQHEKETTIALPYEIMVTDVTNAQFARYLNEALVQGAVMLKGDRIVGYYPGDIFHGHKHEDKIEAGDWLHVPLSDSILRLTYDGRSFDVKQGYENHPMTVVTWFGAKAYCEFYGWRLPSEIEWEKAARGTDNRAFPWGETIERQSANFYASRDPFEAVAGKQGDTTPVGFYNGRVYNGFWTEDARSAFGLYDMAGNVWQWVSDINEGTHDRYLRGGSKINYEYDLRIWSRNSARPDYYSPSVGFRCAR
jgi:formylglycine-generating enzyme required for sulfatase activity